MGELIFAGILLIVSVFAFANTFSFEASKFDLSSGPALFPQICCIGLAVCCVIIIIEILRRKEFKKKFHFLELVTGIGGVVIASSLIFMILMNYLGFSISCAIYLVFIVNYLYYQKNETLGKPIWLIVRSLLLIGSAFLIAYLINMANIMLPYGSLLS